MQCISPVTACKSCAYDAAAWYSNQPQCEVFSASPPSKLVNKKRRRSQLATMHTHRVTSQPAWRSLAEEGMHDVGGKCECVAAYRSARDGGGATPCSLAISAAYVRSSSSRSRRSFSSSRASATEQRVAPWRTPKIPEAGFHCAPLQPRFHPAVCIDVMCVRCAGLGAAV
jgi:hypothetical protein